MSIFQFVCRAGILCAASFMLSLPVMAADVSALQTALSIAQDDLDTAKARRETRNQAITQQQQIVAARKKDLETESAKLEKMQKDSRQEELQYQEALRRYQKAQANLDAAWKK